MNRRVLTLKAYGWPAALLMAIILTVIPFVGAYADDVVPHPEAGTAVSAATDSVADDSGTRTRRGTITPVDIDTERPRQPVMHYYDKHGNPLAEPVRFLIDTDTVAAPKAASPYPLYNGFSVGVNFGDMILMATGQKYGGIDVWADVSLHNWFFPTIEAGVGFARNTPQEGNFTYKGNLSPYFKVGLNYNFLYKSNPDYSAFVGLRAGFSSYTYDITDVTVNSPYWDQSNGFDITGLRAFTVYGEALAGLKVKLWRFIAMGWNVRYRFKMHTHLPVKAGETRPGGEPWYIPGYGTNSPLGISFSLIFTFPKTTKKAEQADRK